MEGQGGLDAERSDFEEVEAGVRCAIVYCHSQAETERVCDALIEKGVPAAFYHSQAPRARASVPAHDLTPKIPSAPRLTHTHHAPSASCPGRKQPR